MIILDMDGVLVDFCRGAYWAHSKEYDGYEPQDWDFFEAWGLTEDEFWAPINKAGHNFWASLPLYPWTRSLIDALGEIDEFFVATKCNMSPHSGSGKMVSLQRIFGEGFRNFSITPRKELLAGKNRILIDDSDRNCHQFEEAGGAAILFPQPWNANRTRVGSCPIRYVLQQLEACYERV